MTFRSEICPGCGGSGERLTPAHSSGAVWIDGGIADCEVCRGRGRVIFEVPKPVDPRVQAAVIRIESQFKTKK